MNETGTWYVVVACTGSLHVIQRKNYPSRHKVVYGTFVYQDGARRPVRQHYKDIAKERERKGREQERQRHKEAMRTNPVYRATYERRHRAAETVVRCRKR